VKVSQKYNFAEHSFTVTVSVPIKNDMSLEEQLKLREQAEAEMTWTLEEHGVKTPGPRVWSQKQYMAGALATLECTTVFENGRNV
jgi:hypothetical protein